MTTAVAHPPSLTLPPAQIAAFNRITYDSHPDPHLHLAVGLGPTRQRAPK